MNWLKNPSCVFLFTLTNVIHFSKHQFHSGVSALRPHPFFRNNDVFRYNSKARKTFKRSRNYNKYVQDHHCIPKQFQNHSLIELLEFDINNSENIYMMPNKKGKYILHLHPDTIVHEGGHHKYNMFVKEHLDCILLKPDYDEKKYEFWLFFKFLKDNLQFYNNNIPWK